jgi:hypothetical protein
MASSVDMASKTPPRIAGNPIATAAVSHSTGSKTFGLAPGRRFSAAWPEVELRSDMASSIERRQQKAKDGGAPASIGEGRGSRSRESAFESGATSCQCALAPVKQSLWPLLPDALEKTGTGTPHVVFIYVDRS